MPRMGSQSPSRTSYPLEQVESAAHWHSNRSHGKADHVEDNDGQAIRFQHSSAFARNNANYHHIKSYDRETAVANAQSEQDLIDSQRFHQQDVVVSPSPQVPPSLTSLYQQHEHQCFYQYQDFAHICDSVDIQQDQQQQQPTLHDQYNHHWTYPFAGKQKETVQLAREISSSLNRMHLSLMGSFDTC